MTVCDSSCAALTHRPAPGGLRLALISLHTSPLARVGIGDAGGMNVYLRAVGAALARAGHQVDIYTRADSAAELARGCDGLAGAAVHYLKAGPAEPVDKADLAAFAPQFAAALARRPRPDLVHSHYWLSGLAGEAAASVWGVAHVQSLHTVATIKNRTLASGDTPEGVDRLAGERALVGRAARVVTVSAAERDAIVRDYGVAPERVSVVNPGVDPGVFHPGPGPNLEALPPALRRPAGHLMMIGRLQPLKGQDLAIRALAELAPGERPALVVTGAPGQGHLEYAAALKALAARLGVARDVVFLGVQAPERLAELIRGARATLMPSHSETFGLVAIESAACGTPVIAADTTGLRSSVVDSVTGLLVRSRRPAAWAKAIRRLLGEPALAARLAAGGVALGRQRTWDHVAAALAATYAAVAAEHARA
ncbi:MAG: glycosyltransferase [Bifidobacteriaceae bacterium]|jgi:D-inositol-3-phosphate glycosyltransferase|nr:glycosyltransferase [Bifidobacteriaceae bacterium]